MIRKIIDYLKELDLSEIEIKLYIKLLETGPISVRDLAQIVKINRTTAYLHIDQLLEKGLIIKMVKGSEKKVVVNTPEDSLEQLIERKQQVITTLREKLPDVLQSINSQVPVAKEIYEADIKYYKGIINARKIYEEALSANELRSYIRIDKTQPLFPSNASVFSNAFKENKKLRVWEIIYDTDLSALPSEESRSQVGRYFYKYMPKSKKLSSEDILIYDGKVAVINFRGKKTSIVLQSYDLYNNFKEIFDFLWDILPEPKN